MFVNTIINFRFSWIAEKIFTRKAINILKDAFKLKILFSEVPFWELNVKKKFTSNYKRNDLRFSLLLNLDILRVTGFPDFVHRSVF
jgi:hypothetical protein